MDTPHKNYNFAINLLTFMSLQICMTDNLLWNIKYVILRNILWFLVHTIEVNDHQNYLFTNIFLNIFFYVPQKKVIEVWNAMGE